MEKKEVQRLFNQHYARMYRVARTILYDEQESEDVVSDIFESLLQGQTHLLPDTEERYLLTSVRNQCFKRLRYEETRWQWEEATTTEELSDADDEDERLAESSKENNSHHNKTNMIQKLIIHTCSENE